WSRSNRRSHRRTRRASGASCLQSKASTTLSLACTPTAPSSSARWPNTRTSTDSATCEALRASSSRWPRNSSEAFTAFGETGGALGAPSTRSHGSQPPCFLAYLRRGFVRRTKSLDIEQVQVARRDNLVPLGLHQNVRLGRDVPEGAALTYAELTDPIDSFAWTL